MKNCWFVVLSGQYSRHCCSVWVNGALSWLVGIQKIKNVFSTFLPVKCCQNVGWVFKLLFNILLYIYIYLCGFHTRCLYWVSSQPSPRSNYSPSPPMKLMTSQSLPPSSASSVMTMSHSIDLAGLDRRKNSLTLHCFLSKWQILPSLAPWFSHKTSQPPTHR